MSEEQLRAKELQELVDRVTSLAASVWQEPGTEDNKEAIVRDRARTIGSLVLAAERAAKFGRDTDEREIAGDISLADSKKIAAGVQFTEARILGELAEQGLAGGPDGRGTFDTERKLDPDREEVPLRLGRSCAGDPAPAPGGELDNLADPRRSRRGENTGRGRMDQGQG